MTRTEMIAFIKANPYVKITHFLFDSNEYIFSAENGNVYEEHGYLFENWDSPTNMWSGANGIRMRVGGKWDDGWRIKHESVSETGVHNVLSWLNSVKYIVDVENAKLEKELAMETETCQYHLEIPRVGLCCEAYYKSKNSNGREYSWFHFPECTEENCPLKHPELLKGRTL